MYFTLDRALFAGVALAAFALAGGSAHANLLQNGSFELGTAPPDGNFSSLSSGDSTTITNWTVGGVPPAGVDYISGYWQPQDGSRSIDLSGSTPMPGTTVWGSLSQTFAAQLGQQYKVSFWLSGNPDGQPLPLKYLDVNVGSTLFQTTFDASVTPTTHGNMGWVLTTFLFVADAASQTITFAANPALNNTYFGPAIDNVDISAVPLPPALLLFGSGLLGMNWLRRRRESKTGLVVRGTHA